MSFGKNRSNNNSNQSFNQNQNFTGTDNTNFNQTTTPTNAPWIDATAQQLNGGDVALSGRDPRSFIAGPQALQTQAGTTAAGLNGSPWNFAGAADLTRGVAADNAPQTAGVQAAPYIQQYQDPYQNDVINATEADLTHNEGLTRARDALSMAGSGAFGGSGAALTTAADNEALARTRASTLAGVRSQGFSQALSAAQQDAQRKQGAKDLNAQLLGQHMDRTLAAAQQLGNLSTQSDTNTRANITTQAQLGDALRQIQQQYASSPLDYQAALTQLFSSLPLNLFHGQNDTGAQNENQTGTTVGSGTSTGSGSSTGFGFGFKQG